METIIILFGVAAAIVIAIVFFGIFGKEHRNEFNMTEITNISGAEKRFNSLIYEKESCAAIYISIFYESLYINADSEKKLRIRSLAERKIKEFCGKYDGDSARVDGNNYIIVSAAESDSASEFCNEFLEQLSDFISFININIGVYIAEEKNSSFRLAAGYAKKAARFAKNTGETYKICRGDELKKVIEKENIEKNIEAFIDGDNFYQVFQPFIKADTEAVFGCEVLTRLDGEKSGAILPNEFLNVIKKDRLCAKFDLYTLKKCCEWAYDKSEYGISVACNFSRATLLSEDAVKKIIDIADEADIPKEKIIIEIEDEQTENEIDKLKNNISLLKDSGFKVCLDNFGKGNTALGELAVLMPDIIGIDKSILYGADNEQGEAVFKNTVRLAKELKAQVLCEGIETKEQMLAAKEAGCDILQGYYFYKPMHTDELEDLLKNLFA